MLDTFKKDLQLIADINDFQNLPYLCKIAGTHSERMAARCLQANIYLEKGNIHQEQINSEGVLDSKTDAFAEQSTYFIVQKTDEDNKLVGAARQINHVKGKEFDSFQIFNKADISDEGVKYINSFAAKDTVEISGLVKMPGEALIIPMYLYRKMWRYSLTNGHVLWVMTITDHLYYRLKPIFGKVIRDVGERHALPNSNNFVIPATLEIRQAQQSLQDEIRSSSGVRKVVLNKLYNFFFLEA